MKNSSTLRIGLPGWLWSLAIVAIASMDAVADEPVETHAWKRIDYPPLTVPELPGNLLIWVDSGVHDSVSHLRFSVHWGTARGLAGERPPAAISDVSKIAVRLHLSGGRVVPAAVDSLQIWEGLGNSLSTDWSVMYFFPWGDNKLEEAWIELRLPQQTYWIELPYGFTRKSSDPLLPDPDHGGPMFPPTMKDLPVTDVLVPWLSVEYDLDPPQNHWHLSLRMSNPFTARGEAVLSQEKGQWDLHTPRTAMETQWPGGRSEGRCVGIRLTDMRRIDDYLLGGGPGPDQGRIWGKVVVKVDDQSYECVVPSSLFKYTHGVTDPYHKQRLPRPKPPDGEF